MPPADGIAICHGAGASDYLKEESPVKRTSNFGIDLDMRRLQSHGARANGSVVFHKMVLRVEP